MDLRELDKYREGNRLEAKSAKGGLPKSMWESYSAFANSRGGVILLGVVEGPGGELIPEGVPKPDRRIDEIWNNLNNTQKVSENLLSDNDVRQVDVDGNAVIAINVPRADRRVRPIYLNDNPKRAFRRNNSGDYLCRIDEIRSMMRDASEESQDVALVERFGLECLDMGTVGRYRQRFESRHAEHVWNRLSDQGFLRAIGAAGVDTDGILHPTRAGLLMFGQDQHIIHEFGHYFLDYRQQTDPETRWQDRITSMSGDWSGNVYDFFFRAYGQMKAALKVPFRMEGIFRVDDQPVHKALREALANCLTNANWFERKGVVCLWEEDRLTIANPGDFRMEVEIAKQPGESDPRNETLLRMFSLVEIGERVGSGMGIIYEGWADAGLVEPMYEERFGPDRTVLTLRSFLPMKPAIIGRKRTRANESERKRTKVNESERKGRNDLSLQEKQVIDAMRASAAPMKASDIAACMGLGKTRTSELLKSLIESGTVVVEGASRSRRYRLANG